MRGMEAGERRRGLLAGVLAMGGSNSGRSRLRPYLGMFLRIGVPSIGKIHEGEHGTLAWQSGSSVGYLGASHGVELHYTRDGESHRHFVFVDRQPCHFGGSRAVLRCPLCNRHCRWLYFYGRRVICRICTRARYWTQTAGPDSRMAYGIRKVQRLLAPAEDADDYLLEWVPRRPPGMRRATYRRLVDRALRLVEKRDEYLEPGLLRLFTRLMKLDAE